MPESVYAVTIIFCPFIRLNLPQYQLALFYFATPIKR
jgi:hypothetical protein